MSQSKGKLIVVILVFAILAISSLACGSSSDVAAAPEPTPDPVQVKREAMEGAYAQDQAVFVHHDAGEGLALCIGTKRAASLKVSSKEYRFEFDSQEALNLNLCRRNAETGNYSTLQNVSGVEPGDYLSWDSSGTLSWTRR